MTPLISIVVPTLNQARYVEQTLASIVGQNWKRLELIVIDGGSTDGTQAIVERYPVQHFVSEPDGGQAAAINKGFRLAKGDILAWLNSDDYYLPLTLARIAAALAPVELPHLVYGNCLLWFEEEQRALIERAPEFDREALRSRTYIIQPSAFWTRALWEKTGELNEKFTLSSIGIGGCGRANSAPLHISMSASPCIASMRSTNRAAAIHGGWQRFSTWCNATRPRSGSPLFRKSPVTSIRCPPRAFAFRAVRSIAGTRCAIRGCTCGTARAQRRLSGNCMGSRPCASPLSRPR